MPADNILVIGPSWVGDMILAQSLFKRLRRNNPQAIIDVAAPGWTLPLLERMPEVNAGIALPFQHGQLALAERLRLGMNLRHKRYTQAILLTNSLKSALLPAAAGIPRRTGFLGEYRYGLLNDIRPLDKIALPRTVDRFVALGLDPNGYDKGLDYGSKPVANAALAGQIENPRLVTKPQNAAAALKKLGVTVSDGQKVLGLCPGAEYGDAKRWPLEYYAEVATAAMENGWAVWLFGSEKDRSVTGQINQDTGMQCLDLGGRTALAEAIDLMAMCEVVVSNDSGLMHLAAALDIKVIAIYGSSDPSHTPPMSSKAVIEYLGLECSPCFQRQCPLTHLNCLRMIRPAGVVAKILAPSKK